jgi:hypothetical protein
MDNKPQWYIVMRRKMIKDKRITCRNGIYYAKQINGAVYGYVDRDYVIDSCPYDKIGQRGRVD